MDDDKNYDGFTLREYNSIMQKKHEPLIDGLQIEHTRIVLFHGLPGCGKSPTVQQICTDIVLKKPVLGRYDVNPLALKDPKNPRVRFISNENSAYPVIDVFNRQFAWYNESFIDSNGPRISISSMETEWLQEFRFKKMKDSESQDKYFTDMRDKFVKLMTGYDACVIESLSLMNAGFNTSDPDFADGLRYIQEASTETGCVFMLVHHDNKSGSGEHGTVQIQARVAPRFHITRDGIIATVECERGGILYNSDKKLIVHTKQFLKDHSDHKRGALNFSAIDVDEIEKESCTEELKNEILNFIRGLGRPVTITEIQNSPITGSGTSKRVAVKLLLKENMVFASPVLKKNGKSEKKGQFTYTAASVRAEMN